MKMLKMKDKIVRIKYNEYNERGSVICIYCGVVVEVHFYDTITSDNKLDGKQAAWVDCWNCHARYWKNRKKHYV